MGPVRAEIDVDVPRERAFAAVGDLALRPVFTDHFASDYHLLSVDTTGVGAGARFRFFAPPKAVWMDTAITEIDPGRRIVERGGGGRNNRVTSTTVWEVEPGPGSLTTIRVLYATESPDVRDRLRETVGVAAHWYERDWAIALRRLRDLLESEAPLRGAVGVAGGDRLAAAAPGSGLSITSIDSRR
ncbi:MAG TPA: SRPBCC family protein [Solirubrobacterales bacterium]|nr:SRPBCC family protein [Solirubrobacterales bacterium]